MFFIFLNDKQIMFSNNKKSVLFRLDCIAYAANHKQKKAKKVGGVFSNGWGYDPTFWLRGTA